MIERAYDPWPTDRLDTRLTTGQRLQLEYYCPLTLHFDTTNYPRDAPREFARSYDLPANDGTP